MQISKSSLALNNNFRNQAIALKTPRPIAGSSQTDALLGNPHGHGRSAPPTRWKHAKSSS
jgi:hypothetical protein